MDFKELYSSKLVSADEAIRDIHNGDSVVVGFGCGEPFHIIESMVEHYEDFRDVEIVNMFSLGSSPWCEPKMKGHFRLNTLFASFSNRAALAIGDCDYTATNFSEIPDVINNYIKPRVAIVTVSPPDEHGYVSFGTNVDILKGSTDFCEITIAQVNKYMPRTFGFGVKHIREFTHLVEFDEPLPESKPIAISDIEMKIGINCASLINDGDCLQLGIGGIPNAVCTQLWDKKDLGLHSELVGEGVVDLLEAGIINNSKKQFLQNFTVLGGAFGTKRLNDFINNNPSVIMLPSEIVNDPTVIAKNDNVVSVNACLQVDLLGQVVADSIGLNQFSAVGGQVDFVRGAMMSKGGRSIIACPSTAKKGLVSRIVPLITEGSAITTTRNDVNYIVTEYGIAQLRGKTLRDRAKALIQIAHPKFRLHLALEYKKRFGEEPFEEDEFKSIAKSDIREAVDGFKKHLSDSVKK